MAYPTHARAAAQVAIDIKSGDRSFGGALSEMSPQRHTVSRIYTVQLTLTGYEDTIRRFGV